MRDLMVAMLMADIVEGVPVSYATFVGYDEVAHHSGIREPDALAVLKRHDHQLARASNVRLTQSPRPYHLVVLSDHGQTQGAPFRQRYGETLEEVVRGALARGDVRAPAAVDEAWGDVGAVLADARQEPGVGGRDPVACHARADRSRARSRWAPTARPSPSATRSRRRPSRRRWCWSPAVSGSSICRSAASDSRSSRSQTRIRDCWTRSPPIPGSGS